ncbi:MAG: DnaA regulatory inactivator Hda [Gammaproteobacteria bacterium]|nr:DnaA regulatory inactivator Hda [Gammaproteobacteria bacterium]
MSLQIPLTIQLRDHASLQNFVAGPNAEVLQRLQGCIDPSSRDGSIYVWGANGTGKTHLLQGTCQQAGSQDLPSVYLSLAQKHELAPEMLEGLEQMQVVCVDDLQHLRGDRDWQEALFHLYNRCLETGCQLVFAADRNIAELQLELADLSSRLAWGVVFQLKLLNDEQKLAALRLRAQLRGFDLPEKVGVYLLRRCPRDMHALFATLDALDKATLAAKRRLTLPFVREWLEASDLRDDQGDLF